jgi:type II secretory pathway pseudopilin PulG
MQAMPNQALRPGMEPPTDGKATASLVLGILSVTCLWIFAGIPAVVLGHMSRKKIQESMGRLKGDGMALAGLILGYSSVVVGIPVMLIIAAIAVPNLLRSRMVANDAGAMSTVRTVNTAQVTYSTAYPTAGYARDLALLGSGGGDCKGTDYPSAQHACLLDDVVAGPQCSDGAWCSKAGFKYSMTATCAAEGCTEYVITATPINPSTGSRSFCSAPDAVVRYRRGPPLTEPLASSADCLTWTPL